jgi:hypothetical protein
VPESALAPSADLAATAAVLGQRAADLGGQLLGHGGSLLADARARMPGALWGLRARLGPVLRDKRARVGLGVLAVLLGSAVVLGGGPARRAIRAVERAAPSERAVLAERARRVIASEKDAGRKAYLHGRLDEALGSPTRALGHYTAAARAGEDDGEARIVALLEHPQCRVREAAAEAAGELRLKSARGELEDLAREGGPDEEGGGLLGLGCDSKDAARDALRRLGD